MTRIDPTRWSELSPLLDEVLELPDEERLAWLDSLRVTRPQVAAELEMLLAELQNLDAAGFMQGDPATLLGHSLAGQVIQLLSRKRR